MVAEYMLITGQTAHSFDTLEELQKHVDKLLVEQEANLQQKLDEQDYYDDYYDDPACPPSYSYDYDEYAEDDWCKPSW